MKTATKGLNFSITHCDGFVANEIISHISDGLVVCESCAVYTPQEINMVLPEPPIESWLLEKLNKTVGYYANSHYKSHYGVDKNGICTGVYDTKLMEKYGKKFLGNDNY